ncbi:hypothetical protein ACA30_13390 [Virgibacillus soli]|nr:hypothetical protein ACA30_13390 [Virgibacillus soli]
MNFFFVLKLSPVGANSIIAYVYSRTIHSSLLPTNQTQMIEGNSMVIESVMGVEIFKWDGWDQGD